MANQSLELQLKSMADRFVGGWAKIQLVYSDCYLEASTKVRKFDTTSFNFMVLFLEEKTN